MRKQQSYTIGEFMAGKHKADDKAKQDKIKRLLHASIPVSLITSMPYHALAQTAQEASLAAKRETVMHVLDPLMMFIKDLSYPIAGVMLAGGCLFIMCGFKEKGMDTIKNAAIGYILVQLSPLFLRILVDLGITII